MVKFEEVVDLIKNLDSLIDGWCERRAIKPLRLLLRSYPGSLAHTDQFANLLDALKDVKGLARQELTSEELTKVISSINVLEDFVASRLTD